MTALNNETPGLSRMGEVGRAHNCEAASAYNEKGPPRPNERGEAKIK